MVGGARGHHATATVVEVEKEGGRGKVTCQPACVLHMVRPPTHTSHSAHHQPVSCSPCPAPPNPIISLCHVPLAPLPLIPTCPPFPSAW